MKVRMGWAWLLKCVQMPTYQNTRIKYNSNNSSMAHEVAEKTRTYISNIFGNWVTCNAHYVVLKTPKQGIPNWRRGIQIWGTRNLLDRTLTLWMNDWPQSILSFTTVDFRLRYSEQGNVCDKILNSTIPINYLFLTYQMLSIPKPCSKISLGSCLSGS